MSVLGMNRGVFVALSAAIGLVAWAPRAFAQQPAPIAPEPAPVAPEVPVEGVEEPDPGAIEEPEAIVEEPEVIEEPEEPAALPATPAPSAADAELVTESPAEVAAEAGIGPEGLSPDDPRYWAEVRSIETLQRRAVLKEGRLGVTGYVGIIPNNAFRRHAPIGVRLNYFVLENLGLELSGNWSCGFQGPGQGCGIETGLEETLEDSAGVGVSSVSVGDVQVAHINFGVMWTPGFGKTAWRNSLLNYFDLYLLGGIGTVVTQSELDAEVLDPEIEVSPEGVLGAGVMFYLNESLSLRTDYRQFIFEKVNGGVANPSELSLGLMWLI